MPVYDFETELEIAYDCEPTVANNTQEEPEPFRFAHNPETGELKIIRSNDSFFIVKAVPLQLGEYWWFVKGGGILRQWIATISNPITMPRQARMASTAFRELFGRTPIVLACSNDMGEVLELDPDKSWYKSLLRELDKTRAGELCTLFQGVGKTPFIQQ